MELGVERENWGKRDKKCNYIDKILVDVIKITSIGRETFII
jgi:hypothetical protein